MLFMSSLFSDEPFRLVNGYKKKATPYGMASGKTPGNVADHCRGVLQYAPTMIGLYYKFT